MGEKEVHDVTVSSVRDLAKAFTTYNDEVLAKREELLQYAQDAIAALKVNAEIVRWLRAVHVAAQYGQTTFLNHIVAKYHADFDVPDNDGRSPLHWVKLLR